jgi:hypothetical protein
MALRAKTELRRIAPFSRSRLLIAAEILAWSGAQRRFSWLARALTIIGLSVSVRPTINPAMLGTRLLFDERCQLFMRTTCNLRNGRAFSGESGDEDEQDT